mgnify:CR=1 FL=1|tara:strand:- start:285 stop:845 length:561 start_codon:yes stop_codon:yes gene_type:complete
MNEELQCLFDDAISMEDEERKYTEEKAELAEKTRKRKERDDMGGKLLMHRAMKRVGEPHTEPDDNGDDGRNSPILQKPTGMNAATRIADSREKAAEIALRRTEARVELEREVSERNFMLREKEIALQKEEQIYRCDLEMERLESMERLEKMRGEQLGEAERIRQESQKTFMAMFEMMVKSSQEKKK